MTAVRALLLTTALAALLAGCNRDREPAPADAPPPASTVAATPAASTTPLTFESRSLYADVRLTLPDAVKAQTDLHARLYAEEVRKLRQFNEGAQGELTEAGAEAGGPKYEKTISVTTAAETAKLLSLKRVDFDYAGGANPNTQTTGLLWDKALKQRVTLAQLFRSGVDLAALDQTLCAAINAARRARVPNSPAISVGGRPFGCPRVADAAFVLTPGTVPGKAAGLTFLIGPYQVGSRAEGAYEIALPLAAFRSLLAVAYADEFGGQLTRAGDVTPASAPAT